VGASKKNVVGQPQNRFPWQRREREKKNKDTRTEDETWKNKDKTVAMSKPHTIKQHRKRGGKAPHALEINNSGYASVSSGNSL
jgi:hypothetical protein